MHGGVNMLINCYDCKKEVSSSAEVCPNCGCPVAKHTAEQAKRQLEVEKENNQTKLLFRIIALVSFLAFFYSLYLSYFSAAGFELTLKRWNLPSFIFERTFFIPYLFLVSAISALARISKTGKYNSDSDSYMGSMIYFSLPFVLFWIVSWVFSNL